MEWLPKEEILIPLTIIPLTNPLVHGFKGIHGTAPGLFRISGIRNSDFELV